MFDQTNEREYHPLLLSRRNEWTAWIITAITGLGWFYFTNIGYSLAGITGLFFALSLFTALGSSLGNWMDRNMVLRLGNDGMVFRNGLQNIWMPWEKIIEMQIINSRLGDKVLVIGERRQFSFRMNSEIKVLGQNTEKTGFDKGSEIIALILDASGLKLKNEAGSRKYYART